MAGTAAVLGLNEAPGLNEIPGSNTVSRLNAVPGLDEILARLDLGGFEPSGGLVSAPGRNENWAGLAGNGARVFVKRFAGHARDARLRMRRSMAFQRISAGQSISAGQRMPAGHAASVAPRVLGWDEPSLLAIFEFIDDATSGADVAPEEWTGTDLASRAGRAVGAVHGMAVSDGHGTGADDGHGMAVGDDHETGAGNPGEMSTGPGLWELITGDAPALPSAALLRGLPLPVYRSSSAGELKAWRLMQRDAALAPAVDRLLAASERAPRVPAHCDLRLDQFLFSAARELPYIVDWEEFRLSDPARDVGSCAGEWLHRAITGRLEPGVAPSHEDMLRHYEQGIERARPVISAFWRGYRQARPTRDPGLADRAAAFAGWHMFDRLLAGARRGVRLSAVDRAAAGIGQVIIGSPADAAPAIGLDPS